MNERRLALIRKRYASGLHASEEGELQALQDHTAKVFEPVDHRRLEHIKSLLQAGDVDA